jgi:prefoldin subunit 5
VNEMAKANTSVDLMKREKKLETRRKELESLLAEVTKEEKAVEKELKSKGWVQQKDGSWSIE